MKSRGSEKRSKQVIIDNTKGKRRTGVSQGEILVLQVGKAGCQGLGGRALQRIVAEPAAGAGAGYDPFFDAHDLLLIQRAAPLAVAAAGLNMFIEQHSGSSPGTADCQAAALSRGH